MQLSGLLEKLRGLFTPAFLISSVTPLFCFILINGAILSLFSDSVETWLKDYFLIDSTAKTAAAVTVRGAVLSIALLVLSYVFSTLNLGLREILEGKNLEKMKLKWLRIRLQNAQMERLRLLEEEFNASRRLRRQLNTRSEEWKRTLWGSRKAGVEKDRINPTCVFPEIPVDADKGIMDAISKLASKRSRRETIQVEELQALVKLFAEKLKGNSTEIPRDKAGHEDSARLERQFRQLLDLIDYAAGKAEEDFIRAFNEREFNFSRYTVAPTRLGNIAESVSSYAFSRYGMNLDCFWTRLQKVLQGQKEFNGTLQDAKTQLDFMVSFFWLTIASTVLWLVVLPFVSHTWLPFAAVWLVGPALARLWYLIAVQNYRSFADLLRSSVDLFRFDLLKELKISPPPDSESERRLWGDLNRKIGYGDDIFICYKESN